MDLENVHVGYVNFMKPWTSRILALSFFFRMPRCNAHIAFADCALKNILWIAIFHRTHFIIFLLACFRRLSRQQDHSAKTSCKTHKEGSLRNRALRPGQAKLKGATWGPTTLLLPLHPICLIFSKGLQFNFMWAHLPLIRFFRKCGGVSPRRIKSMGAEGCRDKMRGDTWAPRTLLLPLLPI